LNCLRGLRERGMKRCVKLREFKKKTRGGSAIGIGGNSFHTHQGELDQGEYRRSSKGVIDKLLDSPPPRKTEALRD